MQTTYKQWNAHLLSHWLQIMYFCWKSFKMHMFYMHHEKQRIILSLYYYFVSLWPYIHLPNLVVVSAARLPHIAQAAGTQFEPQTG